MSEDDYVLDVSGMSSAGQDQSEEEKQTGADRPYVSIYFSCCNVYQRIYRNHSGTAYVGWCPRCGRKAEARIGPDGTTARFFEAW